MNVQEHAWTVVQVVKRYLNALASVPKSQCFRGKVDINQYIQYHLNLMLRHIKYQLIISSFSGRHNVINPGYKVSDLGEACPNDTRIISKAACRATVVSPEFFINDPMGSGHDLPAGCIGDAVAPPHNPVVYWNPGGVAISNDPKLREICKDHSRGGSSFTCYCTGKHT